MPKNGLGSATRWLALNVTETVTVLPKVQGGAGLKLLVRYWPDPALMIGDATETM